MRRKLNVEYSTERYLFSLSAIAYGAMLSISTSAVSTISKFRTSVSTTSCKEWCTIWFSPKYCSPGLYKAYINTKFLGSSVRVYGDAALHLALKNLRIYGSFIVRPKLTGSVRMTKFKVTSELGAVKSKLTGIMNSTFKTKIINAWIKKFINLTLLENYIKIWNFYGLKIWINTMRWCSLKRL